MWILHFANTVSLCREKQSSWHTKRPTRATQARTVKVIQVAATAGIAKNVNFITPSMTLCFLFLIVISYVKSFRFTENL